MSKKLTLAMIKEEVKVYDQKEKIQLNEDTYTYIYPNFAPSKISKMIQELLTDKLRASESGIDFDDINMSDWLMFNIIKFFGDLGIPSDLKKKVQVFACLVDSEHYPKILEAFPQESIEKVNQTLIKVNKVLEQLGKFDEKTITNVVEDVVNEEESNLVED